MDKSIYDLDLHEQKRINDGYLIVRVPGGWLYTLYKLDCNCMTTSFVSYDNSFAMSNLSVNSKLLDGVKRLKNQIEILKKVKNIFSCEKTSVLIRVNSCIIVECIVSNDKFWYTIL